MSDEDESIEAFTLHCSDEEQLVVTSEQARVLALECDFFRTVFPHQGGTTEKASDRIIEKPDWSIETAKKFVELLVEGKTHVKSRQEHEALKEATGQMLVETTLCFPPIVLERDVTDEDVLVRYTDILCNNDEDAKEHSEWTLVTLKKLSSQAWSSLLNEGIAIVDADGFEVKLENSKRKTADKSQDKTLTGVARLLARSSPKPVERSYLIKSTASSVAASIRRVTSCLHDECDSTGTRVFHQEVFDLRIPCLAFRIRQIAQTVAAEAGVAKCFVHEKSSPGFYLEGAGRAYCPTFTGTPQQLQTVLSMFPKDRIAQPLGSDRAMKCCSLRVGAPSESTLERLITACHECQEHPASLGIDVRTNAFFAIKTLADMNVVLTRLSSDHSDTDNTAPAQGV